MESKEGKSTPKSVKKVELKQRIFNAFNSSHTPSTGKEPNESKIAKKSFDSTVITSKKDKLLQLINEKCLDKFKFQQISNEPNLLNRQVMSPLNETTSAQVQTDTTNLIKPVALRPKKNASQYFQIHNTFNYNRTSVDLSNMQDNRIDNDLFNLSVNLEDSKNESLVFANRTNRTSRFIDRRRLNTMSMHSFNDSNLIKNSDYLKDSNLKSSTNVQSDLTKNLIASTVSEITNYFANSENLFEQSSSARPHLNLIKMKIQNLIENTNNSMTSVNEGKHVKKDLQDRKIIKTDRVKKESQLNTSSNEENKVKMRNKSKRNQMRQNSFSAWRSSPSLNLIDRNFEDAKIDLDKIESDLN